jgi:hypothetical protein
VTDSTRAKTSNAESATTGTCANCGARLEGRFCHHCGQKVMATRLSVGELGEEALDQLLSLDGKVLRTLQLLLFRPGMLTTEFLAGRRVQYVSPLRLYLLCSLLFFTLAALMPSARQSLIRVGPSRQPSTGVTFSQRMEQTVVPAGADVQRLTDALMTNLPRAVFVMM